MYETDKVLTKYENKFTCNHILDKAMSRLFIETLRKTTEIEIYKDNILIKRLDLDLSINLNTLRTIMIDEMGPLDWFFTKDNNEITRDEELIQDCS